MKPLLDFDDAGANDDESAKGVTVGDIRAWFDEIEQLRAALSDCIHGRKDWMEKAKAALKGKEE